MNRKLILGKEINCAELINVKWMKLLVIHFRNVGLILNFQELSSIMGFQT